MTPPVQAVAQSVLFVQMRKETSRILASPNFAMLKSKLELSHYVQNQFPVHKDGIQDTWQYTPL